jgi:RimJ/RimL family protein N-acetyltransferase
MAEELTTERLVLRPWRLDDAEAALEVYGAPEVSHWLSPTVGPVPDVAAMRRILESWIAEDDTLVPPAGRWAVVLRDGGQLVGGVTLLPLPPGRVDLEIGWELHPGHWGHGYATEAGRAVAGWAFAAGSDELMAVARPANTRAVATAKRIGMEWVGETEKYYDLRLQVFRLRAGDFRHAGAGGGLRW